MLRISKLVLLTATSLVTSAAVLQPTQATTFDPDGSEMKTLSFNTKSAYNQVIRVISTDKKRWNKIVPGPTLFWGQMVVDTKWPGVVNAVAVHLGDCSAATCFGNALLFKETLGNVRDYNRSKNFNFNLANTLNHFPSKSYANQILDRCNQGLVPSGVNKGPTKGFESSFEMKTTLTVDATDDWILDNTSIEEFGSEQDHLYRVTHTVTNKFNVTIVCEPVVLDPVDPVADDSDFYPTKVQAFLSTFKGQVTKPNPATQCKKGRILARVTTSKAGPVKIRLSTKTGNAKPVSEIMNAMSKKRSDGTFSADMIKWISVNKTTKIGANVRDLTNNKNGKATGWKYLTLQCGDIGGGLAGNDAAKPDQGSVAVPVKVTGKINMLPKTRKLGGGYREGTIKIRLGSNKKGPTSYKLTCSGGYEWSGKLRPIRAGGKRKTLAVHKFKYNKSFDMGCALRSTSMAGNPVIALGSRRYTIPKVNTNVAVGGNGQIKDKPRPSVSKKKKKVFIGKVLKKNKRKSLQKPQRKVKDKRKLRQSNRPFIKKRVKKKTSNRLIMKKRKRSSS